MKIREAFFIFLMMAFGAIAIMYRVRYDKAVDNSANHIEMGYVVNGKYQPVYARSILAELSTSTIESQPPLKNSVEKSEEA